MSDTPTRPEPDQPEPTSTATTPTATGGSAAGMPARVPPAFVTRFLDQTTDVSAGLAAVLLDAIRDIHALCARHRSHGNRAIPVVEVDIILGRRLRPHLDHPTVAANPDPSAGDPDDTSETTS